MTDRSLITTGAIGAALAAICCATPLLAVVLGRIGLSAWLVRADYLVVPVLLLGVALVGPGFTAGTSPRRAMMGAPGNGAASEQRQNL
jgi:mercuric ion transport protein